MVIYNNMKDLVHQAECAKQELKWPQVATPASTLHRSHTEVVCPGAKPAASTHSNNVTQKWGVNSRVSKTTYSMQSMLILSIFLVESDDTWCIITIILRWFYSHKMDIFSASDEEVIYMSSEKSEEAENLMWMGLNLFPRVWWITYRCLYRSTVATLCWVLV